MIAQICVQISVVSGAVLIGSVHIDAIMMVGL